MYVRTVRTSGSAAVQWVYVSKLLKQHSHAEVVRTNACDDKQKLVWQSFRAVIHGEGRDDQISHAVQFGTSSENFVRELDWKNLSELAKRRKRRKKTDEKSIKFNPSWFNMNGTELEMNAKLKWVNIFMYWICNFVRKLRCDYKQQIAV